MNKFNIDNYVQEQREHILNRYEKHCADTGKHETLTHYLQHFYIPLGYAQRFHDEYFKKVPLEPLQKENI